jgi:hypothetical protein
MISVCIKLSLANSLTLSNARHHNTYKIKHCIILQNNDCHILLQNENGPCPLLAAANCLLLKRSIQLPSNCIGASVVTIDQLTNLLAEKVLLNHQPPDNSSSNSGSSNPPPENSEEHHFAVSEVLNIFPSLQYGMDVNPKFTKGPTGVEYTMQLNAFDLLHVDLVHGWLVDPSQQTYECSLIGNQTYNQLVNQIIRGNEAKSELERILVLSPAEQAMIPHSKQSELALLADHGTVLHDFLQQSGHQLTQYGLGTLYSHLKENDLVVFFRNNHFNTLTKKDGLLYLLVTDLGYANVDIVWEKLDVIDGDTEYMTANFLPPPPLRELMASGGAATGEQLVANSAQSQSDYHLALQLSQENNRANHTTTTTPMNTNSASGAPLNATSAATAAVNSISNTFAAVGAAFNLTGAADTRPLAASLAPHDQELEAARQASLELYQQQQQQQRMQQRYVPAAGAGAPPGPLRPGSVARVPVGRPSPLGTSLGIPTVAIGVPATLAPGQIPVTSSTFAADTTITTTVARPPTVPHHQECTASSGDFMMTHNHMEEQDRWLALQMQQDDSHEASQQLALQLEREDQARLAASSRRYAAPPPRRQPTMAPPHKTTNGSASEDKCVIS